MVIGSRYVLGGGMLTSRFRYWGSYAFNIVIRVVLGLRIHDNLSGYLAFRPTLLRGISPEAVFYGYGDYAIRLLHHVVREGGRVLEIPTVYRFRKGGESKTRFLAYSGRISPRSSASVRPAASPQAAGRQSAPARPAAR